MLYKSKYSNARDRIPEFTIEPEYALELLIAQARAEFERQGGSLLALQTGTEQEALEARGYTSMI